MLPKWLRNRGTVRNRHLTKHETETLIAEIWTSKLRSEETRAAALDVRGTRRLRCWCTMFWSCLAYLSGRGGGAVQEFVQMFFKKKFGISTTVVEWGAAAATLRGSSRVLTSLSPGWNLIKAAEYYKVPSSRGAAGAHSFCR